MRDNSVLGIEPIRQLVRMLEERFGQAVMSAVESRDHIIKTLLHFFVRQFQDPSEDRIRPGLLLIEAFVAGYKEPSHHSRSVGCDMDRRTSNDRRFEH